MGSALSPGQFRSHLDSLVSYCVAGEMVFCEVTLQPGTRFYVVIYLFFVRRAHTHRSNRKLTMK